MRTLTLTMLALLLGGALLAAAPLATPAAASGTADTAGLTFMREEEKLARDVYLALGRDTGLPIFQTIAASEQVHMDRVAALLDRYGIDDPAAGQPEGAFTDPTLQALYADLVVRGGQSVADALAVGAAIEEIDIRDLQARLTPSTPADIAQVYTQLLRASGNHLRAFVGQWEARAGGVYEPQYLDPASFQAIVAGDSAAAGAPRAPGGAGRGRRGR